MKHFYFHLRDHVDETLDDEGSDLCDLDAVKVRTLAAARDIMAADLARGIIDLRYRIDVEDTAGRVVYTLPFKHAVSIIPEEPRAIA